MKDQIIQRRMAELKDRIIQRRMAELQEAKKGDGSMRKEQPRTISRFIVLVVLMLTLAFSPAAAFGAVSASGAAGQSQTADQKIVTKKVKKQSYSWSTKKLNKKSVKVKKGTTKLILSRGVGYVRFKAPKKKNYTILIEEISGKVKGEGFVMFQKRDKNSPSYCFLTNVRVKKKKTNVLRIRVPEEEKPPATPAERVLALRRQALGLKRTSPSYKGTIRLKKNETLYIYFDTDAGKTTLNMTIS